MKPWPHLFLAGRAVDVATTTLVLGRGGIELNPLWIAAYNHGPSFAFGLQLLAAVPITALGRRLPFAWPGLLLASWIPVAWNLLQFN